MLTTLIRPGTVIFDVTMPLSPEMAVWPGDAALEMAASSRIASGSPCNVSTLTCSTHAGTHVDAPWHFEEAGVQLEAIAPERWIGPCYVVNMSPDDARVTRDDLERADIPDGVERLILRTRRQPVPANAPFDPDYAALAPDAARWLLDRGIALVGIDTPSIEPFDDATNDVHHALLGAGMLIVEGLELSAIEPGPYQLICLPLRLMDADGSPARALLVRTDS